METMQAIPLDLSIISLFLVGGIVAGFIDSIAGGGGLITLPLLSIVLGPGVHAIASNKIAGFVAAITALVIYARKGGLDWRRGINFCICTAIGSYLGSLASPFIPAAWMRWLLILACPIILFVVWRKESISGSKDSFQKKGGPSKFDWKVVCSGLACGFYDGAFGPGGGTFMLLSLLIFVQLPVFSALAVSKLANTISAFTSLLSYAHAGSVHWEVGGLMAIGILIGALLGSNLNMRKAGSILRPVLVFAVSLLMARMIYDSLR